MFAILAAFDVLAPFIADDVHFETDFGPVGLKHLGHQFGVGIVRALDRHGPEGDLGAFFDAGGLSNSLAFSGL